LNAQGEKLRNVESKLDDINENLTATQKNINQIKSVFGGIKNRFFSWTSNSSKYPMPKSETNEKINAQINIKPQQPQSPVKADFVKVTNSARENQIGEHLDLMSESLARIKEMAGGMSTELDRQNNQIERLGGKFVFTDERIRGQTNDMKKLSK